MKIWTKKQIITILIGLSFGILAILCDQLQWGRELKIIFLVLMGVLGAIGFIFEIYDRRKSNPKRFLKDNEKDRYEDDNIGKIDNDSNGQGDGGIDTTKKDEK